MIHFPHAATGGVRDVDVARSIKRHVLRMVQHGTGRYAAVSDTGSSTTARKRRAYPTGHLFDGVPEPVHDEDGSTAGDRQAMRLIQARRDGGNDATTNLTDAARVLVRHIDVVGAIDGDAGRVAKASRCRRPAVAGIAKAIHSGEALVLSRTRYRCNDVGDVIHSSNPTALPLRDVCVTRRIKRHVL